MTPELDPTLKQERGKQPSYGHLTIVNETGTVEANSEITLPTLRVWSDHGDIEGEVGSAGTLATGGNIKVTLRGGTREAAQHTSSDQYQEIGGENYRKHISEMEEKGKNLTFLKGKTTPTAETLQVLSTDEGETALTLDGFQGADFLKVTSPYGNNTVLTIEDPGSVKRAEVATGTGDITLNIQGTSLPDETYLQANTGIITVNVLSLHTKVDVVDRFGSQTKENVPDKNGGEPADPAHTVTVLTHVYSPEGAIKVNYPQSKTE